MKAIVLNELTGAQALTLAEVSEPEMKAGEVLIRTAAAGINPIDVKTAAGGGAAPFIGDARPFIPGWECTGTVIGCGSDVTGFKSGDRVVGFLRFPERAGCFAEHVSAPADQWALLPDSIDDQTAAGLALAGLTAYQALYDKGHLQAKKRVLVLAAAGGVGHIAVQLAKAEGAYVVGTASTANHERLITLGCDEVIDYRDEQAVAALSDFDLIIDGVGGETGVAAVSALNDSGTLVTLPSVTKDQVIGAATAAGKRAEPIRAEPNGQQLSILVDKVAKGELSLNIAAHYPASEVKAAYEHVASGHTHGKVVITF
jgi:NADPH2:quinone reductase